IGLAFARKRFEIHLTLRNSAWRRSAATSWYRASSHRICIAGPVNWPKEITIMKRMTTRLFLRLTLVAVCLLAMALTNPNAWAQAAGKLRISMIPATDPGKMLRDGEPLVNYLEKELGAKIEMTIPTNYAAVVEAIANDQVDIAHFGGFTFVQASARAGAKPLVQRD